MSNEYTEKNNYSSNSPLKEGSIFFQAHAIWVLLIFFIAAIWLRLLSLIVVSVFLLFLFVIITLWKNASLNNVILNLRLSKTRLFADEGFEINASITNDKWLPLIWIEMCFPQNEGLCYDNSSGKFYTVRFLWLLWFQKVEWSFNGKGLQRGVYPIGQVTLRSGDGFRFSEKEKIYNSDEKIYVYPRLVPVHISDMRPSLQWGARGRKGGLLEDPLMVIGIREYQAGDELKRFNWNASARTGKLLTNVYQPVVLEQLVFYIDVDGFVIYENAYENPEEQKAYVMEKKEAFERFLSVIASIAVKYTERGIGIGFASNGSNYYGQKMPYVLPSTDLMNFLDQLALITQRVHVSKIMPLDEMFCQGRISMPVYIFCNQVTKAHYMWYQKNKEKLPEICFYYNIETEFSEKMASKTKPMDTFLIS
ncbi:MAG: DUF58 domain-containing protein [Clostridiales bacterium]|nr:DUF58 domain-containing protein [Clostridiales bacterium]